MSPGRPDHRLRSLLAEARWTGQQLASAVNAVGAEAGLRLRYDRTSVAHWLSGSTPNAPVPELIAEAFTRRLGREIAAGARPDESERAHGPPGAQAAPGGPGLCPSEDAIAALVELRSGRRRTPRGGVYSIAELAVPPWPAVTAAAPPVRPANGRIGREEAEGAAAMARVFSDGDATFGGGRQVAALSSYLALDVAPKLRARAGPTVRAAMFAAATDLAYLCAFMHFDSEQHATAQRYYRTALKLAAENHDPTRYATILRAMSVQAHTLRHHRQALDLAEASLTSAPGTVAPITRAFLLGQAAVAAAGTGDKPTALTHLRRAETLLERGTGPGGATGAYHHAALAHQKAAVLGELGDLTGAIDALTASIRHRPAAERRARAITLATLAHLHLRQGNLEIAAATCQAFLKDYPHLDSGRAKTALATMRAVLRPHQHHRTVAETWHQAATIATSPRQR